MGDRPTVNGYDVVIVGGAVIGSAVAYSLAVETAFDGRVLVIERDPSYEGASTSGSWGGIRQQFSTPQSVRMSLYGAEFLRRADEHLGTGDGTALVPFHEHGYLILADETQFASLSSSIDFQRSLGAVVERLNVGEISRRFPEISTDGLAGATFGPRNEGWVDPGSLLQAFRRKERALGVEYRHGNVTGLALAGRKVTGIELGDGTAVAAGVVVNAGGLHAAALLEPLGIDLPVGPHHLTTFVFDCERPVAQTTFVIDPSGMAVRPEGGGFIVTLPPRADENPFSYAAEIDYSRFDERIWPLLARRIPAFEAIKLRRAWLFHYDYNHFDQNAILGPHPEWEGLLLANGFSGHGVQHSPAAGRAIAELITFGGYRTLDLDCFGYQRIVDGEPLTETMVIGGTQT